MTDAPRWTAERTVDAERAWQLVAGVAPALRDLPVTALSEGWDNTVFRVGPGWTARFPRRGTALPGFRRELAVLPRIAGRLPLPVPLPEWHGTDDAVDPWPFAIVRFVPGEELSDSGLTDDARTGAAAALGAFLRELHAGPTRSAVADLDLPVDPLGRGWPRARRDTTRAMLDGLVDAGTWPGDPAVGELLSQGEQLDVPGGAPVLVHGDLHARHLLVDPAGAASGVIDWGDVCLADPAVDLSSAYAAFTGRARAALLDAYGPVDGERELRARCLAARMCGLLAEYAAGDERPALLAEALAGLRRAVS